MPRVAPRGRRPRKDDSLAVVRRALEGYANRGVFRSYSELPGSARRAEFRFLWFRDVPFRILYDPSTRRLTFPELLPEVEPRGEMDRELRRFLKARTATTLPDHRRIDPRRLAVTCVNRQRRVSLTMTIRGRDVEHGVRKAVNVVHEIFVDFLNDSRFTPYLVEHFRLDPELA